MGQRSGRGKHWSKVWSPCDYWLEGRGRSHHRMQCQEDSSTGSRGGAAHNSGLRLPSRRRLRGTGTPRSRGARVYVRQFTYPGPGIRGIPGATGNPYAEGVRC